MHILVAHDLGPAATRASERAHQLVADTGADLTLFHIVDAESPGEAAARAALAAETARMTDWSGISAGIAILAPGDDGGLAEIGALAGRTAADIVIMGEHAASRRRSGAFVHSLAGRTLATLGLPVLIASRPVAGPYGSAVIGVDFSPFSRTAIRAARRFAPTALLHLLHAYRVPFQSWLTGKDFAADYAYGERLAFAEFLEEEMAHLMDRALAAGTPETLIRTHLKEGDPVVLLRELVRETESPLAVVGTHGRTGLARLLLGSVAADLTDDPPADLLVTPMAIPA